MTLSQSEVLTTSEKTGFNPVIVEKVIHLINLLNALNSHPFLKGKWVLKGGTALNLFIFNLPRLSVDIDLNYIGAVDREKMMRDRPKIEQAVQAVFSREGFNIKRVPTDHAGGKWILGYQSYTGQPGNIEVDFNFMFRQPLWSYKLLPSYQLGKHQSNSIPVLNIHELTAGKLAALLARSQARDLYDSHRILTSLKLQPKLLRISFVVYGGMNRVDWRTVSKENISFDPEDLSRKLLPVLHSRTSVSDMTPKEYGKELVQGCKEAVSVVLPLKEYELDFLDQLLEKGVIDASFLTEDSELHELINNQPLLKWKALNVRKHKGLT